MKSMSGFQISARQRVDVKIFDSTFSLPEVAARHLSQYLATSSEASKSSSFPLHVYSDILILGLNVRQQEAKD